MRRAALALLLLAASVIPLACAGPDGRRAQELLAESDQALAQVESFRFAGRMTMGTPVGDFHVVLHGGGDARPGGSFFMTMKAPDVPGFPETTVAVHGDEAWLRRSGIWQRMPVPSQATGIGQLDLVRYVKDVDLDEDAEVDGEPAVKITGVLDTAGLFDGLLGQLGAVASGPLPDLSEMLGDTRAVIYLSRESSLPLRMLLDLSLEIQGETVTMNLDYAITNVNEPVEVPGPGA
jgi:hypothetical protein